ncbi:MULTISPECIES: hypothetical protein [Sporosarcina]|uniref:hypothetical protein n=1 Tax=Sporosarcina TaxID=1569 RepID=UPI00129AACE5|nr:MULTISPECIES: hypothetical protein [Sporosarcina]GKV64699.1 hypothetical protein NCCP2331_08520 [Sporosarcina sp. NCCP-2331]GLB54809.1 hypothetical protein NCCP2378_05940 [Sporosarcina sp. NCCP-2378]
MVRRRGLYEVNIIGKQLCCTLCGGVTFRHREVYLELDSISEDIPDPLTLQSLTCEHCSTTQLVQQQVNSDRANIEYIEVGP